MQDFGAHPPFAHNPHVYGGVDPDAPKPEGEDVLPFGGTHGLELFDVPAGTVIPSAEDVIAAAQEAQDDDEPVDVDGDGEITGYEVFSKADLITECESRGLSTAGNKPDLVRRLQEHDAAKDGA